MAAYDCICAIVRYYPNFLSSQNQQNINIHFVYSVTLMQNITHPLKYLP